MQNIFFRDETRTKRFAIVVRSVRFYFANPFYFDTGESLSQKEGNKIGLILFLNLNPKSLQGNVFLVEISKFEIQLQ